MKTRVAVASGLAAALVLLGFSTSVRGSISGFGDNGTNWTLNSTTANKPVIAADHLLITQNGEFSVAKSAWFNTSQSISGEWVARFTVRRNAPATGSYADGCAFVIQNNDLTALGAGGGNLGYSTDGVRPAIANSIALGLKNFVLSNAVQDNRLLAGSGGVFTTIADANPINLNSSDFPIDVTVYNLPAQNLVRAHLQQASTIRDITVFNGSLAGTAIIGFTGATGGASQSVEISNFSFTVGHDAPSASDDHVVLDSSFDLIHPLDNDFYMDSSLGNKPTIIAVTTPRFGTATLVDLDSIEYQAGDHFPGIDTFTYTIANDTGEQSTARITVTDGTRSGTYRGVAQTGVAFPAMEDTAMTVTYRDSGAFTAQIRWKGQTFRFKGIIPPSNIISGQIPGTNLADNLFYSLYTFDQPGVLVAYIGPTSFNLQRDVPPTTPGRYSMRAALVGSAIVTGPAFATGTVAADGSARFVGRLADNRPFAFASATNIFQRIPFFLTPYTKAKFGSVVGEISLTEAVNFVHKRPAAFSPLYPAGFAETFEATTALYTKPAAGTRVLPYGDTRPSNASVIASEGGLAMSLTQQVFLDANNKVQAVAPNALGLKFKIKPAGGLISGSFLDNGKVRSFKGVVFQPTDAPAIFAGDAITGTVRLKTP